MRKPRFTLHGLVFGIPAEMTGLGLLRVIYATPLTSTLQPRRLRFVRGTLPAKRQNFTDGITSPVRLWAMRLPWLPLRQPVL